MIDYEAIDPSVRTPALIGDFLQHWAIMESQLNTNIGKALGLSIVQEAIVTSNISFRDKIHILRTTVSMALMTEEKRKKFDKTLVQMAKASGIRNMMAHNMFATSADGACVEFMMYRAKGTFSVPHEKWTVDRFKAAFSRLKRCTELMDELEKEFANAALIGAFLNAKNRRGRIGSESPDRPEGSPSTNLLDLFRDHPADGNSAENSQSYPDADDEQ